ncbi:MULTISPECIES: L,D-transpeptidase family protein [Methylomicrobium]|nr:MULTISPECIES: L,D-transpeptidase family protein [Methylomicrobium]
MNKPTAKIIAGLALTGLLVACSGHKPASLAPRIAAVKPQPQVQPDRQMQMYYIPPKPSGERTVADVLQIYGEHTTTKLKSYFAKAKVSYPPQEVTLVALKQEMKLELWARDSGAFRFIRDYRIRAASGVSGPKLRQGDMQVPEGIYRIAGLNPNSHFHLSMKLDYPNEFDLFHAWQEGRTNPGSDIFIHGQAKSIGCLAMGDETIEELFVLAAHTGAGNVKVVIAPHDPRTYPLAADIEGLPAWTPELYSIISREINALTPGVKSAKTGL